MGKRIQRRRRGAGRVASSAGAQPLFLAADMIVNMPVVPGSASTVNNIGAGVINSS